MFVPCPRRLTMCWSNWAEFKHSRGSVDDLCLNLRVCLDAFHMAPCMCLQWCLAWCASRLACSAQTWASFFLWSAPVAFRRVALETPEWTSRDSNHHRQSVSAGKKRRHGHPSYMRAAHPILHRVHRLLTQYTEQSIRFPVSVGLCLVRTKAS